MSQATDLIWMSATRQAALIRNRDLSVCELLEAHLSQIQAVNPQVNAIVTLEEEQAREQARRADAFLARGGQPGPLFGLPVAHKDTFATRGMRTTFGSRLYEHHVPTENALVVERQQQAGAISIGKTNTPEFAAGSQTFNEVFGVTRNPYDGSRTCGGSSGGAAVALASGMVPLADGSDLFGSLRCPAAFCNVVGMRPSLGRVPRLPKPWAWDNMSVAGPMARTVEDIALFMSVLAQPDLRDPVALTDYPDFLAKLEADFTGVRVALSPDLGELPVASPIHDAIVGHASTFSDLGCMVEMASPDFSHAFDIAMTMRSYRAMLSYGSLAEAHPGRIKETLLRDIQTGQGLSASAVAEAEKQRTALFQRVHEFMQTYEFMVFPATQALPFPHEQEFIEAINGVAMRNYVDWVSVLSYVTVTGHPAISVPAGFTPEGLPIGIQIVGRYHADFRLLQLAYAFEQATRHGDRRPEFQTTRRL